jgi:tetratricopeptide (TPR) repeat protein
MMTGWITAILERVRTRNLSDTEKTLDSYEKGVAAIGNGRTAQAIRHFTDSIAAAPNSSKLYHHRADAFALNGQHLEAIVDYDVAVRIDPSYPDTYLDRGNSRYAIGHLTDAIKDFSEAIRLKPDWAEAYANRAVVHADLENPIESGDDEAKAKSLGVNESRLQEMLNAANSSTPSE